MILFIKSIKKSIKNHCTLAMWHRGIKKWVYPSHFCKHIFCIIPLSKTLSHCHLKFHAEQSLSYRTLIDRSVRAECSVSTASFVSIFICCSRVIKDSCTVTFSCISFTLSSTLRRLLRQNRGEFLFLPPQKNTFPPFLLPARCSFYLKQTEFLTETYKILKPQIICQSKGSNNPLHGPLITQANLDVESLLALVRKLAVFQC